MLISEICIRPAIWAKQNKNYFNRIISDKMWGEIAEKMKNDSK